MPYRPCPACDASQATTYSLLTDVRLDALESREDTIGLTECVRCGLLYTNPCPEDLPFTMQHSYGSEQGRAGEQSAWIAEHAEVSRTSRVIDIGCGDGALVQAMQVHTDACIGIDYYVSPIVPSHCFAMDITQPDTALRSEGIVAFDVAILMHVLEHMQHSRLLLQALSGMAQVTSRLVVEVPILETAAMDDICHIVYGYGHLTQFTMPSLAAMLSATGWAIEETKIHEDFCGYRIMARPCSTTANSAYRENREAQRALNNEAVTHLNRSWDAVRNTLKTVPSRPTLFICGVGWHTELLWHICPEFFQRYPQILGVDRDKHGGTWRERPIISYNALPFSHDEAMYLVSSYASQDAIVRSLQDSGIPSSSIVTLYGQHFAY